MKVENMFQTLDNYAISLLKKLNILPKKFFNFFEPGLSDVAGYQIPASGSESMACILYFKTQGDGI